MARGAAQLAIKGEYMAVGIRPTTIKKGVRCGGTRGQGRAIAVDMRAATIKGACGVAELAVRVRGGQHARH